MSCLCNNSFSPRASNERIRGLAPWLIGFRFVTCRNENDWADERERKRKGHKTHFLLNIYSQETVKDAPDDHFCVWTAPNSVVCKYHLDGGGVLLCHCFEEKFHKLYSVNNTILYREWKRSLEVHHSALDHAWMFIHTWGKVSGTIFRWPNE